MGLAEITSAEVTRVPPLSDLGSRRDIERALGEGHGLRATVEEVQTWIYSQEFVPLRDRTA